MKPAEIYMGLVGPAGRRKESRGPAESETVAISPPYDGQRRPQEAPSRPLVGAEDTICRNLAGPSGVLVNTAVTRMDGLGPPGACWRTHLCHSSPSCWHL